MRVTGAGGVTACATQLGGSSVCVGAVPAENCLDLAVGVVCGAGTRNSHWKESTFRTELMTGYAGAVNPLSRLSIEGLADLGYTVDPTVADAILDRIVHSSHRIALKGGSLRKPEGQADEEAQ